ncbi:MAG: glycoside hydrolase family 2 TIM barrel-domain containing protein, partial [Planctomycetota bacterium]|nr:glycoside hydrolase family 2 TIM barrel-domain containing protein [Planctomycetota bacterium]
MRKQKTFFVSILILCLFTSSARTGFAMDASRHVVSLDGVWQLAIDPDNVGKKDNWFANGPPKTAKPTAVPGALEETFPDYDGVVWYWKTFRPSEPPKAKQRVLLRFAAADYFAEVWLNGRRLGQHEGGETPFALDATAALKPRAENRLVARVINPNHKDIDGFLLQHVPHGIKIVDFKPGSGRYHNYGGLWQSVELQYVPEVRVLDVFAEPRLGDGRVIAHVTLLNESEKSLQGEIAIDVRAASSNRGAKTAAVHRQTVEIPCGRSTVDIPIEVADPKPWSPDDPFLYRMAVSLSASDKLSDSRSVRFGFREFTFRDGWFRLNGKRLILKSAHTAGHYPMGLCLPPDREMLRRELRMMKEMGFNCIRSLGRLMFPEQLDYCDELGLLVYEETYASWLWRDSPKMGRRFDDAVREGILRDRNHPSLVIWGLLNEMQNTPIFRHAAGMLPLIRKHDPSRLVMLNSGRWDGRQAAIGHLCLPGSEKWTGGLADFHAYPRSPFDPRVLDAYRTLPPWPKDLPRPGGFWPPAFDDDQVFASEFGTGSAIDPIRACQLFQQHGARADLEDYRFYREMARRFEADWRRFGLEKAFPTPSHLLRASESRQADSRRIALGALRANPNLCGISLTGQTDSCMAGEGVTTIWREHKRDMPEALRAAFAPLTWSIFTDSSSIYSGQELDIEVLLINEDKLPPGKHPVRLEVYGPSGVVWSTKMEVNVKPGPIMVHPAFHRKVKITGPTGPYAIVARLEGQQGKSAAEARSPFYLSDPAALPEVKVPVTIADYGKRLAEWLKGRGIEVSRHDPKAAPPRREVILVATARIYPGSIEAYGELMGRVDRGSVAVFLMPKAFAAADKGL